MAQHFPDDDEAQRFLSAIASRLSPCGLFFSAHLSPPDEPLALDRMLQTWRRQAASAGLPDVSEVSSRLGRDLALRSSQQIRELHQQSGFEAPSLYFRSLIYTAWLAHRAATGRLDEMG